MCMCVCVWCVCVFVFLFVCVGAYVRACVRIFVFPLIFSLPYFSYLSLAK